MKSNKDDSLIHLCPIFDTDYIEYGGRISKWSDPNYDYADCSCGCKYFIPLYDEKYKEANLDFGVCTNKKSKRCGSLTFEHQAGFGCFQAEKIR